jgi:S-formylglutathione hydrolase
MRTISENRTNGGVQGVYTHASSACACDMTFGLFLPSQAEDGPVPLLWFLSGLTCTHENAMVKANDSDFALGQGAGFYVNATQAPWAPHFRMWDYVTDELPRLLFNAFPLAEDVQGITGHSMGGHGALTIAMSFPGRFRSVSAFAPICNPVASEWGRVQFSAYLGKDEATWTPHDATLLTKKRGFDGPMLVDQGTADQFLDKLRPEALAEAMAAARQGGTFRMQKGYDHSYFFVSTFMEDHVSFHAEAFMA